MKFVSFEKIENIGKCFMSITQKIHGSNAQIYIFKNDQGEVDILCGSRNRWLSVGDDNFGFAAFVNDHKQEFIEKLGEGRHFGEWAGPGINSGEGLSEKKLFLFNWERWKDKNLPAYTTTVPLLYQGKVDLNEIDFAMECLKKDGSKISPGYMFCEGVVVQIGDNFYKKTFIPEDVAWKQSEKKGRIRQDEIDVSHLLQLGRLKNLLSKDEKYFREFPENISKICQDYMRDLFEESPLEGTDDEIKAIKKQLGRNVFGFVKQYMHEVL